MGLFAELCSVSSSTRHWAAAALGLFAHNALFIRGEWHLQAPDIAVAHVLGFALLAVFEYLTGPDGIAAALSEAAREFGYYVAALLASMTVYRALFHPLRRFPGPPLASVTKLWHAAKCLTSQNHLVMEEARHRYGEFVRIGPSELAIFTPDVVHVIDGPGNVCTKSVWYDMMVPELSIVSSRDKGAHDARRRIWDQGFSIKALSQYEQRVLNYVDKLNARVGGAADAGTVVNGTSLMYFFGWDVMGEVIFGRSFGMLDSEDWHVAVAMLKSAMRLLGPITPVPWLAHIGFRFLRNFWAVGDWFAMINFCRDRMQERVKRSDTTDRSDIASWLIADARKNGFQKQDSHWLTGDSILAIVAGSDTVTATLICLFYRLAQDPSRQEKLAAELKGFNVRDSKALQGVPYLTALINETLRMYPALPTGGLRQTLGQGITVGGTYVPPYTTIAAPRYSLGRLESCFVQPNEFIPERWTTRPELVKDARAFVPFGVGRFNCIGKNLGWSELRLVTAVLVSGYHVSFAPGEDGHRVEGEMRDFFTPNPGRLDLVFSRRGGK